MRMLSVIMVKAAKLANSCWWRYKSVKPLGEELSNTFLKALIPTLYPNDLTSYNKGVMQKKWSFILRT